MARKATEEEHMEFLMALLLAIGLWAVEPAGDEAFGVSAEEGEVTAMDGGGGFPPPPPNP